MPDQKVAKIAESRLYLLRTMNQGTSKISAAGPRGSGGNANAYKPQAIAESPSAFLDSLCLICLKFHLIKRNSQNKLAGMNVAASE